MSELVKALRDAYEETDEERKNLLRDLTKMVDTITLDRLAALVDAERDGRVVVLPCKVEPFDCQHCKHLSPSDTTNRLFCSYRSEGEHQYEVYLDDYCSDFDRAAAEQAKGERE